jgi:transcriptional regulator
MTDAISTNLMRGTLDLLVLRAIEQGDLHGFAVARWIRDESGDQVAFEDAAVYQALHRLERQSLVESSWGRSENNRRARFYRLTSRGRGRLATEAGEFRTYTDVVLKLLGSRP